MTHQSNVGLQESNGKYVYRNDSDIVNDRTLVEDAVQLCESKGLGGVSIFWAPDPTMGFWARVRDLEKSCYKGDLLHCGARFVRRDAIEAVGGWNESITAGEDYDLYNRLAEHDCRIGFIETGGLHIGEPRSLGEIVRKQFAYGKTIRSFLKENKSMGLIQISPVRPAFMTNANRFLRQPVLALGFVVYETVVYSSTLLGFLASVLSGKSGGH